MNLNEKAQRTVRKLLKLTRQGEIRWERSTETALVTSGTDTRVDVVFEAKQRDLRFRVYEASYQISPDGDAVYWTSEPRVEIIDSEGIVIWRLPSNAEMWDLLNTIQLKASNIEGSLDSFLDDED